MSDINQDKENMQDIPNCGNTGDNMDIGCFSSLSRKTYEKSGKSYNIQLTGHEYELKAFVWIAVCALKNKLIRSFSLAANLDGVGCWDDIVLKYTHSTDDTNKFISRRCFVQIKLKHDSNYKLNKAHFSSEKGAFSIKKLVSSFSDIQTSCSSTMDKEIFDDKPYYDTFIVYTNAGLGDGILNNSNVDCILSKDFNTGDIFSIGDVCLSNDINNDVKLFSSQSCSLDLDCKIKRNIAQMCDCSEIMADWIYTEFMRNVLHYYEKSYFLTKEHVHKILVDAKKNIYCKIDNGCNNSQDSLSNGCLPVIDDTIEQYVQQAVMDTLSPNDLESLNNFQIVETTADENLKDLSTLKYGNVVSRPSKFLKSYYTALWLAHNFDTNRGFLLRKLFLPEFQFIKQAFDSILASGLSLHNAVLRNDVEEVKRLLKTGVDVNTRDIGGRSPLHLVAAQISETNQLITHILLKRGADIHIVDRVLNRSPLQYADLNHSWIVIAMLLERRGSVNDLIFTSRTICYRGCDALLSALKVGGERFVYFLIENGVTLNGVLTEDGLTPLHVAAQYGNLAIVKFLVECGADITAPSHDKKTPLFVAYENNHDNIAQYFHSLGAVQLTVG